MLAATILLRMEAERHPNAIKLGPDPEIEVLVPVKRFHERLLSFESTAYWCLAPPGRIAYSLSTPKFLNHKIAHDLNSNFVRLRAPSMPRCRMVHPHFPLLPLGMVKPYLTPPCRRTPSPIDCFCERGLLCTGVVCRPRPRDSELLFLDITSAICSHARALFQEQIVVRSPSYHCRYGIKSELTHD